MTKELQRVSYVDASGHYGRIKIEIYASIDNRDFIEEENWLFREASDQILKGLSQNSYKMNEKYKKAGEEQTRNLISLFDCMGAIYVKKIPNEYWADHIHEPWLMVTTSHGHFKIGWRKSVIVIDWSDTDIQVKSDLVFNDQNVTKDDKMIHAHGYEKAKEYILKLNHFNNILGSVSV